MAHVGTLTVSLVAQATAFEKGLKQATKTLTATAKTFERQARLMERTGKSLMLSITAPLALIGAAASKAAIDWENAFAGVRKTVDATEAQFAKLDNSLRQMTGAIPLTHRELAGIAETAGQLGIQVENISEFTRVMAMMGTATNMASDEAAMAMAQIANIMQSGQKNFDRMGATVVHLGNNLATTERHIANFGLRIAAAGKIAGFTEAQVFAVGGAFASVGVEAEAGGTAVSKVWASMTEAVATGNKHIAMFAATAGMTSAEFATAWRTDAGEAFTRFVEGLGRSGDKAFGILRDLGLKDQRLLRGFLSVAGAGDLLRRSIDMGTKAWRENAALTKEAEQRYKTLASQLKMARNRIYNVAIAFGESLAPYINAALNIMEPAIEQARRMAEAFGRLNPILRTTIVMSLLLVASIGPAIWGYGRLLATIGAVQRALVLLSGIVSRAAFAFAAWRGGAATLGETLSFLVGGKIKLVILGIGALVVATILIIKYWDQLKIYAQAAWSVVGAAALYGASLVVRGVGLILAAIGAIIPAVRGAAQSMFGLADSLKASAASSLASAKAAIASVGSIGKAVQSQADVAKGFRDIEGSAKNAADMQDKLADSMNDASKSAGKNLQSFDEVHQLQEDMGKDIPELDMPALDFAEMDFAEMLDFGGALGGMADFGDALGEQFGRVADMASSAWERLIQAMEPVNRAVEWIKENWPTIGPIIEDIAGLLLLVMIPALIKTGIEAVISGAKVIASWIAQGWEAVASVTKQVAQMIIAGAKWVWLGIKATANAAKVVVAWVIQGIEAVAAVAVQIAQFVIIGAKWVWLGVVALANAAKMAAAWVIALGPVAWITAAVIALAVLVITNWDLIREKTIEIWGIVANWLSDKWDWIKETAGKAWEWIGEHIIEPIQAAWDWLVKTWDTLGAWLSGKWNNIKTWAGEKWENIKGNIIGPIQSTWTWLENTWGNIAGFLDRTWGGIKRTAGDIWKGIANTIIGFVNGIIDAINTMIGSLNNVSFDIPDWVPGRYGGKSIGFDLSTINKVPMLAKGTGYVPADMFAYLHKGEAVVPKAYNEGGLGLSAETLEQAVYRAFVNALRAMQASSQGSSSDDKELVLKLDGNILARTQLPALRREAQRQGFDLLVRPQGV